MGYSTWAAIGNSKAIQRATQMPLNLLSWYYTGGGKELIDKRKQGEMLVPLYGNTPALGGQEAVGTMATGAPMYGQTQQPTESSLMPYGEVLNNLVLRGLGDKNSFPNTSEWFQKFAKLNNLLVETEGGLNIKSKSLQAMFDTYDKVKKFKTDTKMDYLKNLDLDLTKQTDDLETRIYDAKEKELKLQEQEIKSKRLNRTLESENLEREKQTKMKRLIQIRSAYSDANAKIMAEQMRGKAESGLAQVIPDALLPKNLQGHNLTYEQANKLGFDIQPTEKTPTTFTLEIDASGKETPGVQHRWAIDTSGDLTYIGRAKTEAQKSQTPTMSDVKAVIGMRLNNIKQKILIKSTPEEAPYITATTDPKELLALLLAGKLGKSLSAEDKKSLQNELDDIAVLEEKLSAQVLESKGMTLPTKPQRGFEWRGGKLVPIQR